MQIPEWRFKRIFLRENMYLATLKFAGKVAFVRIYGFCAIRIRNTQLAVFTEMKHFSPSLPAGLLRADKPHNRLHLSLHACKDV